ncbi:hypothetical protein [Fodinicola acaciae]|uniref:hypothetical protein n=1 Tax=Fodinicola acaciae TaxID=2681555 RepID=UPI0013D5252C|nr:hypothetical protein [Fodinicola acaciae]
MNAGKWGSGACGDWRQVGDANDSGDGFAVDEDVDSINRVDQLGGEYGTALHWLPSGRLVVLYEALAGLISRGGAFFNADHLSSGAPGSFFHTASAADDSGQQEAAFSGGAADWEGWWGRFRAVDGFAELIAERDRRFRVISGSLGVTPTLHTEALRVAGFTETGTLWQHFNDYVVYGIR